MIYAARKENAIHDSPGMEWIKSLEKGDFTYKDYKKWPEDFRLELIDGMVYLMASGDDWHQWLTPELARQIGNQLAGKKCLLYTEFDVRLFYEEDESDKTIVQPDILVVCDQAKLAGGHGVKGAPDFIIEILSEFNAGFDLIDKKKIYEKAGVREYWILARDKLYVNILYNGVYRETVILLDESFKINDYKQGVETINCILDFTDIIKRYNLV